LEKLGRKFLALTIKAVESEGVSFSDPLPSVLRRSQVTKNTKMFDETVAAYLKNQTKIWFTKLSNVPPQGSKLMTNWSHM